MRTQMKITKHCRIATTDEDDEVNYETYDEEETGDQIMASNLMKARVTERAEDTDEDKYNGLHDDGFAL